MSSSGCHFWCPGRQRSRCLRRTEKARVAHENLLTNWGYGNWFSDSGRLRYIVCYGASRESRESGKKADQADFSGKKSPRSRDSSDLGAAEVFSL